MTPAQKAYAQASEDLKDIEEIAVADDLVERVIQAASYGLDRDVLHEGSARDIIAIVRNETLEEAAKTAMGTHHYGSHSIAAAIRAMIKETSDE